MKQLYSDLFFPSASVCLGKARLKAKLLLSMLFLLVSMKSVVAQTTLSAGDIIFTSYDSTPSSTTGGDGFSFVLLAPISSGTTISFTDRGYNGSGWQAAGGTESTLTWTSGSAIAMGTEVYIRGLVASTYNSATSSSSANGTVTLTEGSSTNGLSLSDVGDQIIAFQGGAGSITGTGAYCIAGINYFYSGTTTTPGWNIGAFFPNPNASLMPPGLIGGNSAFYTGSVTGNTLAKSGKFKCEAVPTVANAANIRTAVMNMSNWILSTASVGQYSSCNLSAPGNTAPTVSTTVATTITATSATLGGNVTADGGAAVTERGIVWATTANPTTASNKVAYGTAGTGTFSQTVSGLPSGMTIYYRAFATNSAGTAYGNNESFATLPSTPISIYDKLYWHNYDISAIESVQLNGQNRMSIASNIQTDEVYAVAVDPINKKLYWNHTNNKAIYRSNFDGLSIETIVNNTGDANCIVLDPIRGKIYWNNFTAGRIERANLDGTSREIVIEESSNGRGPVSLTLDISAGNIYWFEENSAKIKQANLDGQNIEEFATGVGYPWSLYFDHETRFLYWDNFANGVGKIERKHADNGLRQAVVDNCRPVSVTIDKQGGKIYWHDQDANDVSVIMRANLNDGTNREIFMQNPGFPYSLVIPYDYSTISVNNPPAATSVSIIGTLNVGQTLTGTYTYTDSENNTESGSTFKWYRSDDVAGTNKTAIASATAKTYTLTAADAGKYISFEVTPKDGAAFGTEVESAIRGPVVASPPVDLVWELQNSAADNLWRSVTYGNGVFVAVAGTASNNAVMTSSDGVTWAVQTTPESENYNLWNSVTYGNNLFVAVASSGGNKRVMTSPDGINWTSRATPSTGNYWSSVTYGNGRFVAVASAGDGNNVMTSEDGVNWTQRTPSEINAWRCVTYGGGQFVAVASNGTNRVMTSPDGINWTSPVSNHASAWYSVTYGGSQFVAVANNGTNRVMTSPDGITWTLRSAAAVNTWYSVCYGEGQFVAVGDSGTGKQVMTSTNGINWTLDDTPSTNRWYAVTYGDHKFVAVAISGDGKRVMTASTSPAPVKTLPTITTATIASNITTTFATLGGNVTDDGGAIITERGIVWATTANPTTANNKVIINDGTGSFNQTVNGLPSGTTIYYKAYATNSIGTAYGNEISFTTPTFNALYFDDNARITGFSGINPTEFTVEFKLFLDSEAEANNWQGIYWSNDGADVGIYLEDDHAVSLWTTKTTSFKSDAVLTYGAWNHVAISGSAGGIKMYINGVETSYTEPGGNAGRPKLPVDNMTMGYGNGVYGTYGLGNSALDDFRIWNEVRTLTQINQYRSTELTAPYPAALVRYYDFNHGIGGANNAGQITLAERTGNGTNATLSEFNLNGNTSNWVETASLQPVNTVPVASNIAITGTLTVGQTLTGTYTYADADNNAESGSTYKWYRSDNASGLNKTTIGGAVAATYTLAAADAGKYISFEVTPKDGTAFGIAGESNKIGPVTALSKRVYVNKNVVGGNGNGDSWANAKKELADALKEMKSNSEVGEIWVAGGTYKPMYSPVDGVSFGTDKGRENAFLLVKDVKVYGGFAGTENTLADRNLSLTANASILSGDIDNNDLPDGTNNTNNAYHVVLSSGDAGIATLNGFTIKGGYADGGGNTITVSGNLIKQNSGAGIYNYLSSPLIEFVTVSHNSTAGGDGAGICNVSSNPKIVNSLIHHNGGNTYRGGGVYNAFSAPELINVTIADNTNNIAQGAVFNDGGGAIIKNSIIWGNSANEGIGGYMGTANNSIIQGEYSGPGTSVSNLDPQFTNAAAGDYTLSASSPAVNEGSNSLFTGLNANTKDLAGNPRVYQYGSGIIDMGAYELQQIMNNAPVLANLNGDSVAWPGTGNTVILDAGANAAVSDAELNALNGGNGDYAGSSLSVQRIGTATANDTFGFNTPGALFTVSGNSLQSGGQTFATFTNTGGVLTIAFNSSGTIATQTLVNNVLQRINYGNDTPAGDASLRFTFSDGSVSATANVTVTSDTIYITNSSDTGTIDISNGVSLSEAVAIAAADATGSQTLVFASHLAEETIDIVSNLPLNESLTFVVNDNITISNNTITLAAGTTATFSSATNKTLLVNSILAGAGNIVFNGGGVLHLTTANTGAGSLSVNNSSLKLTGNGKPLSGALSFQSGDLEFESIADLTLAGAITIAGNSKFNVTSGSVTSSGNLNIQTGATLTKAGNGYLKLTGSTAQNNANFILDGGTFEILSPNNLPTGSITIQNNAYFVANQVMTIPNPIILGNGNALVSTTSDVTLSGAMSGAGNLSVVGPGTLTLQGANSSSGNVSLQDGVLNVATQANLPTGMIYMSGSPVLNITSATTIANKMQLSSDNPTISVPSSVSVTLSGVIEGAGNLYKDGTGTLSLSGTNTYTGQTYISAGTLNITGSIMSGVNNNAKLGGTGSITGNVYSSTNATLSPGTNSAGTLTINGDLTLEIGSIFEVHVDGATAGTGYSQVKLNGAGTLRGALSLIGSYVPQEGDSFTFIDNVGTDVFSYTFSGLFEGDTKTFNTKVLKVSYAGGTGNDFVLSMPPAIISATYDAATGTLVVTGANLVANAGANNDIEVTKIKLVVQGGIDVQFSTLVLTPNANVEINGNTFTMVLTEQAKSTIDPFFNKNGTVSTGGTNFYIKAEAGWLQADPLNMDLTGNLVTVSNVAVPSITSAMYNAATGVLSVAGTNLLTLYPDKSFIANKFTLTGQGGDTYTLVGTADAELTPGTSTAFIFTLDATDKAAVNTLLNKNGTISNDATTYNLAAAEDWNAGADAAITIADLTGNGITVSGWDETAPTISSVAVPANGTYKIGDHLDFTLNLSEATIVTTSGGIPVITLTVGNSVRNAEYVSGSGTSALIFRYTIVSGDADDNGITVGTLFLNGGTLRDAAGNDAVLSLSNVGSTVSVLADGIVPALSHVGISSNNAVTSLAKTGDEVTVTFTASEAVSTPVLTIAGHTVTVANTSGNTYAGKYTMTDSDTGGTITFSISFSDIAGNSGTAVNSTTNSSSVTFDKTAPATPTGLLATSGDTQNELSWTAGTENDLKGYKIYGGTSANPTSLLNTVYTPTTNYTHTGLTNGITYYYRISAFDNAGNESTVSADVTALPKAPQTITFNALEAKTYGNADFDPGASSTSGLTVSYTSDNTAVATIVAGKIRIVGAGTATITASQAGNAAYLAASDQTQVLTVSKKDITVSLNATPAITKVYNANTSATLTAANYSLSGVEAADVSAVTVTGTAVYASRNAASDITVTVNNFVLEGTKKDNYNLTTTSATTTGAIIRKDITLTLNAMPLISKVYDGNTSATLVAANYSLNSVEASDAAAVDVSGTAVYNNSVAGTGKMVTVTDFVLAGAQRDNYRLTTVSATTNGTIAAKVLAVTADDKEKFEGEDNPTLSVSYDGFITGEHASNALATQPLISTTATANSPHGTYPITVSGASAQNYQITYKDGVLTVKPGAPTSVSLAAVTLYENQPAGTVAGTLSSASNSATAVFTYSLVAGQGDTDNARFAINGNQLLTADALDYEAKQSYSVRVRSTTQYGFSLDEVFTISVQDVNEAPTMDMIANQVICYTTAEQTVNLTGMGAGPEAWQTVSLSVSGSNPSLLASLTVNNNGQLRYKTGTGSSGTSTITVKIKDNGGTENGGIDEISRTFNITVNPLPVNSISSDKGNMVSKGETAVLSVNSDNGTTYTWSSAKGIVSGENTATLTVRPMETTTYTVLVRNANGCESISTITIEVKDDFMAVEAENFITPNGDGVNDNWVIKNIDAYPNHTLTIVDRSGKEIYSVRNYKNDWNGTLNGSPLAPGTYYYIIRFDGNQPARKMTRGFITIVKSK